jgi:heptosyltransferase-1
MIRVGAAEMLILVVKMSALGDVVHALPVIPTLKRAYPNAQIHWVVEEMAEPIVRSHSGVDRVLVSRRAQWSKDIKNPYRWPKILKEMSQFVKQLRQQSYDVAIDLQGLLKSGIWLSLVPAKRKVGYNGTREGSYVFLNERIPPVSPDLHAVQRYLYLVHALGAHVREVNFGLTVQPEARTRLGTLLAQKGWMDQKPYAVLVPKARWETKEWGEDGFAVLADMLVDRLGLRVAVTGIDREATAVVGITRKMIHPALNLTGETDLPMLMALLQGARVVIATDSGPMHIAAAMGTPVVAVFGPTAPWRTGPYGEGHRVVKSAVSCSPCFKRKCDHKTCMRMIGPAEVLDAVCDVMRPHG